MQTSGIGGQAKGYQVFVFVLPPLYFLLYSFPGVGGRWGAGGFLLTVAAILVCIQNASVWRPFSFCYATFEFAYSYVVGVG